MNKIYNLLPRTWNRTIAMFTIIALLASAISLSAFISNVKASQLTWVSDTLSDSNNSARANHTISFFSKSAISASSTIVIDFPDSFSSTGTPAFSPTDATDYDIATSTDLSVVAFGSCTGSGLTSFEITSTSTGNVFTFTHCNGSDALAANTTTTIEIGTNATFGGTGNSQLINAGTTGSYVITLTGPSADTADLRVAILPNVTVTATVSTNLTFTVSGVASGGQNANGQAGSTSITTTATTIPWGTLTVGTTSTARQDLAVSTNARNGFTVTVFQDQNLTSNTGADIDKFDDGVDGAPQTWASPAGTLDSEDTYGHEGITSEDATLQAGDTFGTGLYDAIGTSSTPLAVFYHTGPANGSTANKGATKIGFQIEISSLQEAASDYTQTITYIATPIF